MGSRHRIALLVGLTVALAGCGEGTGLDVSELPRRLADARIGIQEAGYEVEAVKLGPEEVPALLARNGNLAVVLAVGRPGRMPPVAVNSEGERFPTPVTSLCDGAYIAITVPKGGTAAIVKASGLC